MPDDLFYHIYAVKSLLNYGLINQVKEFILKNIDKENLTIDEIASELYMSRTAFFNKWKALTGEAPKYFIYRIRSST